MTHGLVEIPRAEWPKLRDLYEGRRTDCNGYRYLQNYIDWVAKDPDADVTIYSLDGDWEHDGTYIVRDFGNIGFSTLSEDQGRLLQALNCLEQEHKHHMHGFSDRFRLTVDAHLKYCGLNPTWEDADSTLWHHLPKEQAIKLSAEPPPGYSFRRLDVSNAEQVNRIWPHRSDGSVVFVERLIGYNDSVGLFTDNGTLVAWVLILHLGSLGLLQVEDTHKRRGFGSLIVRYMAQKIASRGLEPCAPVVFNNKASKAMFEKLGFKIIDRVWFLMPGAKSSH